MMFGDWLWWWVTPVMACFALFVAAIVGVLTVLARSGVVSHHQRTPEQVLGERFARGVSPARSMGPP
jgi:uncharacterized membrane protein